MYDEEYNKDKKVKQIPYDMDSWTSFSLLHRYIGYDNQGLSLGKKLLSYFNI